MQKSKLPFNSKLIGDEIMLMLQKTDELLEQNEPLTAYDNIKTQIINKKTTLRALLAALELIIDKCVTIRELDREEFLMDLDVIRNKFDKAGGERIIHIANFLKIFKKSRVNFTYMIRSGPHKALVPIYTKNVSQENLDELLEEI